jgi:hypothetical protein
MPITNKTSDTVYEHGGLSGARSGDYEHGTLDLLDRLPLALIGNERGTHRLLFDDSHRVEHSRAT